MTIANGPISTHQLGDALIKLGSSFKEHPASIIPCTTGTIYLWAWSYSEDAQVVVFLQRLAETFPTTVELAGFSSGEACISVTVDNIVTLKVTVRKELLFDTVDVTKKVTSTKYVLKSCWLDLDMEHVDKENVKAKVVKTK